MRMRHVMMFRKMSSIHGSSNYSVVRLLLPSSRVGIVVNSCVSCQFVRATELLSATWESAGMWLLASVRADMSCLML